MMTFLKLTFDAGTADASHDALPEDEEEDE